MKKFAKKYLFPVIGICAGALSGYFYWTFEGCRSGTCAITSSPLNSMLYGVLIGGLLGSIFQGEAKKKDHMMI